MAVRVLERARAAGVLDRDQAACFELYRTTAAAIKGVDARLQVGGPATANNGRLDEFTAFCRQGDVPVDFISTHLYPTDAFGAIDIDTASQLADAPHDMMRSRAIEARAVAVAKPLYNTEWSIGSDPRDPLHDASCASALAVRIAMSVDDVVDGYSYRTSSDIFDENDFPGVPYHGGFGMMDLHGVPKPIYRAFELLASLGDAQRGVTGTHDHVVVGVGASSAPEASWTTAILINQAMPRHAIAEEAATLRLKRADRRTVACVSSERIDDTHAHPAAAWRATGAPEYPTPA